MKKGQSPEGDELFLNPADQPGVLPGPTAPLAVRMRPASLEEVCGQSHLLGAGKLLRRTIQSDRLSSLIFYGPPGTGKTTLARVIAGFTQSHFVAVNAVTSNVAELRSIIDTARKLKRTRGMRTILFVDEIHRFNKAQQDVLMPDVEDGTLILMGATTHNPSFSINGPLLSRSIIFELRPLGDEDLHQILKRALGDPDRGFGKKKIAMEDQALQHLVKNACGDARRALNALEVGVLTTLPDGEGTIRFTREVAEESCQRKIVYYDGDADYHYDTASAFIKSMRGSDPDAAIYWLAKMIYAGEDPRFIIRRILILASEDIGNADPQALILAASGLQALEFVGMPEGQIILAHLVTYMATAPKSNASYAALTKALDDVKNDKPREVPNHLRDRSYAGAKRLGHGEGYKYAHDFKDHYVEQEYLPKPAVYYQPTQQGYERTISERITQLRKGS